LAGFFARNGTLDPSLQEFFAGFSIIISYLFDPDGIFRANIARCSKAQFIVGPHRPDDALQIHATEVLLKPLERLAIFAPDPTPRLNIPAASHRTEREQQPRELHEEPPEASPLPQGKGKGEGEQGVMKPIGSDPSQTPERRLALHPGSGSERKNWPEQKWAETLHELLSFPNLTCVLIGGEAEEGRLQRLVSRLPSDRIELAENLRLVDLAARLRSCDAFVGHDSGITHLAAAVGLPVIALWGETSESVWRPKGTGVLLLKHERGISALPVNKVLDATLAVLLGRASVPASPLS